MKKRLSFAVGIAGLIVVSLGAYKMFVYIATQPTPHLAWVYDQSENSYTARYPEPVPDMCRIVVLNDGQRVKGLKITTTKFNWRRDGSLLQHMIIENDPAGPGFTGMGFLHIDHLNHYYLYDENYFSPETDIFHSRFLKSAQADLPPEIAALFGAYKY